MGDEEEDERLVCIRYSVTRNILNIRKEWLVKIKREHVPKHLYVCSDHFESECYEKNMQVSAIAYFYLLFFQVYLDLSMLIYHHNYLLN